jgi:carbon-monoxide dehydrogenase large subunit
VLERLIDRAATELGVDAADLRARNMASNVTATFTAVTGLLIEGGRFLDNQTKCLAAADRDGFPSRRAESQARGRLRGFGFACFLETNGGLQVSEAIKAGSHPIESAALTFDPDGSLDIVVGTQSTGQDHARPLQVLAQRRLGVDPERVTVREGDSTALVFGSGTGGSKSTLTSLAAVDLAITEAVERARGALADKWGVEDVAFTDGVFQADGGYASSVAEVAADLPGVLDGQATAELPAGSSANGCHACEVEIDPTDGVVRVLRYTAVDDFGRVIDADTVRGQVQGGVAQGIGAALIESAPSIEELVAGTATYRLPTAVDVPTVNWIDNGMPLPSNVLGAKGCGESGASAAPPTVMNAIADALRDYPAARDLQMPARPEAILAVLRG